MPKNSSFVGIRCENCDLHSPKYKCPGCGVRTCSVVCVKKHKVDTKCDGRRSKTHFVSVSKFDENQLMSDYMFLEDIACTADTAIRSNIENGLASKGVNTNKLSQKQRCLLAGAKRGGVHLQLMSKGMSRPAMNISNYNTVTGELLWTIEWKFLDHQNYCIVDELVPATQTIMQSLSAHLSSDSPSIRLDPTHFHQLSSFVAVPQDTLYVYLQTPLLSSVNSQGTEKLQAYHRLDTLQTWDQVLHGKTIFEFPTVVVSLKSLDEPVCLSQ